jgi:hypothetical protein
MSTDKNGLEVEVRGNLGLRRSNLELQSKNGEATGKKVEVYNCEDRIANVHRQEEVGKGLVSKFAIPNPQSPIRNSPFHLRHFQSAIRYSIFDIPSPPFHLRHSIFAIPS